MEKGKGAKRMFTTFEHTNGGRSQKMVDLTDRKQVRKFLKHAIRCIQHNGAITIVGVGQTHRGGSCSCLTLHREMMKKGYLLPA